MALPVPTRSELATFKGVELASLSAWADQALAQSTFLLSLLICQTEIDLADERVARLVSYGSMDMAHYLYLTQPFAAANASPYQSETIGSYTYSKRTVAALSARKDTGVFWFDMAVRELANADCGLVSSQAITVFEKDSLYTDLETGRLWVLGPSDLISSSILPFDVNVQTTHDPG